MKLLFNIIILTALIGSVTSQTPGSIGLCEVDCDKDLHCKDGLLCAEEHRNELKAAGFSKRKANCGRGKLRDRLSEVCFDPIILKNIKSLKALQIDNGLQLKAGYPSSNTQSEYYDAVLNMNWSNVELDLIQLMTSSKDWWPADYGHYGGLFIRLAWHTCGSYRKSDGRGGCDGAGIKHDPERSWPDNTNLDKARILLEPIKAKYGPGLSYGDLYALAGTLAIESMGFPVKIGFCPGRMDMIDNSQTIQLGPSPEQDKFAHCEVNGKCPFPLGANTLGLIYVNPEGPMGVPNITGAAETVREVFGRMDWTGRELVALIGGGHTFGKTHGASTSTNGDPPNGCPFASWNGPKGVNTITSGFEGPWTTDPTKWSNSYFRFLFDFEWEPIQGPGGKWQFQVKNAVSPQAPVADPKNTKDKQNIMMLTTDIAMKEDPEYKLYVQEFATNQTALTEAFAKAWYKLVTRDMGPVTRCAGKAPPAQTFQDPLPAPVKELADMMAVRNDIKELIIKNSNNNEAFIRLAYQCASTYRATDYRGGCNGARIRFPPGIDWPINSGLSNTIELLKPIKLKYGVSLSYADLIVLAGTVAVENISLLQLKFCPGRTDAVDGSGWNNIEYGITDYPTRIDQVIELIHRRGQTYKDFVGLTYPKFKNTENLKKLLFLDDKTTNTSITNTCTVSSVSNDAEILSMKFHPELRYWAENVVSLGTEEYAKIFADSWTRLMNADRFDGPIGNVCEN